MRNRLLALLILVGTALPAPAQTVHSVDAASLKEGWSTALSQAGVSDAWIVFSFDRMMCERCFHGSWSSDGRWDRTIADVLHGRQPSGDSMQDAVRRTLDDLDDDSRGHRMVLKELAVLMRVERGRVTDVHHANLDSPFDFDGRTVYWLGKQQPTAIAGLFSLREVTRWQTEARKGWVWTLGSLDRPDTVLPLLVSLFDEEREMEVRKAAVFATGNQEVPEAVTQLRKIIGSKAELEVRKAAVFALGNNDLPQARAALLDIIETLGRDSL